MIKIKEAVKCVPVILGYFLLTELGKVIDGVGSLCRRAGSFRFRETQDCCLLH